MQTFGSSSSRRRESTQVWYHVHSATVHYVSDAFGNSALCMRCIRPRCIMYQMHSATVHYVSDPFGHGALCIRCIRPQCIMYQMHSTTVHYVSDTFHDNNACYQTKKYKIKA